MDLQNGEEINEVCAGCHGEVGQGGKEGEYLQLAGLPASFIAEQLVLFRNRSRKNLAMVEYVDHRRMPDPDILDISAYLAAIELPGKLPPVDESAPDFNAYQRLLATKQVVQIPRAEGNVQAGKKRYKREWATVRTISSSDRRHRGSSRIRASALTGTAPVALNAKRTSNLQWVSSMARAFHGTGGPEDLIDPGRLQKLADNSAGVRADRERVFNALAAPNTPQAVNTLPPLRVMPKLRSGVDPTNPTEGLRAALTEYQYQLMSNWTLP